jgi:hypothetical protein
MYTTTGLENIILIGGENDTDAGIPQGRYRNKQNRMTIATTNKSPGMRRQYQLCRS